MKDGSAVSVLAKDDLRSVKVNRIEPLWGQAMVAVESLLEVPKCLNST